MARGAVWSENVPAAAFDVWQIHLNSLSKLHRVNAAIGQFASGHWENRHKAVLFLTQDPLRSIEDGTVSSDKRRKLKPSLN